MTPTLKELQQMIASKPSLGAKLRELERQRAEYDRRVVSMRVAFREEQADVEKLEGRSLANYFFQVVGKLDDKLTKERQEAYAARVKLDAAERELAAIDGDIQDLYAQLSDVRRAQEQYNAAILQKHIDVRDSNTTEGERLREMDAALASLEAYRKEIREAINAGSGAQATADRILGELESADNWNTWDMFGGGGMITHMAKHSHLDQAQDLTEELQQKLRRFKTELADIQITADSQVNIDGFLRFADYFFDGLFVDWSVGNRIKQSRTSISDTRKQITRTLDQLNAMEQETLRQIERLQKEQTDLLVRM